MRSVMKSLLSRLGIMAPAFTSRSDLPIGATAAGRRDPPGLLGSDVGLQAAEARGLKMLPG